MTNAQSTLSASSCVQVQLPPDVLHCKSVILHNEDRASVGTYVLFQDVREDGDRTAEQRIGCVDEILVDPSSKRLFSVLLMRCSIGESVLPYKMPSCRAIEND